MDKFKVWREDCGCPLRTLDLEQASFCAPFFLLAAQPDCVPDVGHPVMSAVCLKVTAHCNITELTTAL